MNVIPLHRRPMEEGEAVVPGRVPSRAAAPPVDERELVRRLATGDVEALTAVSAWLWDALARYAYRIVEDEDVAADLAQEAFVRLWQARGRAAPRSLRPYLFRITRNLALDHLKVARTRRRLLGAWAISEPRRVAAPDEVIERERVTKVVQRAIQKLPERRREVFVLAYLRGLTYVEISETMGISPKTVQNHMTGALAALRAELAPLVGKSGAGPSPEEAPRER